MASNDYYVFKIIVVCFSICPFSWLSLSLFVLDILTAFSNFKFSVCENQRNVFNLCGEKSVDSRGSSVFMTYI